MQSIALPAHATIHQMKHSTVTCRGKQDMYLQKTSEISNHVLCLLLPRYVHSTYYTGSAASGVSKPPDGVDLAVFVHQLCAQQSSDGHVILEAMQLVLQCLEAGCLCFTQMLLIAADLQSISAHFITHCVCCARSSIIIHVHCPCSGSVIPSTTCWVPAPRAFDRASLGLHTWAGPR